MWQVFLALLLVSMALVYNISSRSSANPPTESNEPPPVSKFKTEYQWKKIIIDSLEGSRQLDVSQGVPFDFDRSVDGRIFMTLVLENKSNVSLATIREKGLKNDPLLTPYPNSNWFLNPFDCRNITSAQSIKIDNCNRLWVLDTGYYNNTRVCDPKVLVFNLKTNELWIKSKIPKEVYSTELKNNVLLNPIVEMRNSSCKPKNVYMAESQNYGIVKWNGTEFRQLGVNITSKNATKYFNILGTSLFFPGGTVPLVLNPNSHTLSLALLTSNNLLIPNKTDLERVSGGSPTSHNQTEILNTQSSSFRFSTNGKILFMGRVNNFIQCWRVEKKFDAENIDTAIVDNEGLQFIRSIKIYPKKKLGDDRIWVLMDRSQKTTNKSRNFDEINFRILHVSMKDLIKDTHCN